ncbi:hypothetical protein ABZ759_13800 [Streptomyces sp. NPDC047860]|uniref:hypothetical protein n=1 Tax=Streptomyces sp. NPDC047860 TaxID=3155743 RepID=UPI0033F70A1C
MAERIRTAHDAPAQAPTRLPASRFTATGQREATTETAARRAGRQRDENHDQAHRLVQDDDR